MKTINCYGNICAVCHTNSPWVNAAFLLIHIIMSKHPLALYLNCFLQILQPILEEVLPNCSQMPDKLFFSAAWIISYARYMVWTAFPTWTNVKQTLTILPVNSSHHQNRAKKKKVSLAQLGLKHVVKQMFLYSTVTVTLRNARFEDLELHGPLRTPIWADFPLQWFHP